MGDLSEDGNSRATISASVAKLWAAGLFFKRRSGSSTKTACCSVRFARSFDLRDTVAIASAFYDTVRSASRSFLLMSLKSEHSLSIAGRKGVSGFGWVASGPLGNGLYGSGVGNYHERSLACR